MLCGKCQKEAAVVHITTVVNGTEEETLHFCKHCAPPQEFAIGKNCEFCGGDAFSGEMRPGGIMIYWCLDCSRERADILKDLLRDAGLQACSGSILSEEVTRTLKERRRQDGRDRVS